MFQIWYYTRLHTKPVSFPYKGNRVSDKKVSQDSSVGIVTRYGLDGSRIESRWGAIFSAPVLTGSEAYPTSYKVSTGSFPGVKRPMYGIVHPSNLVLKLKKE